MVSQACTINIWQLAVWCCSVWTFCAAVAYTRPRLGQLSGCAVGQCWGKCPELGWPSAGLTHAISLAWPHTNQSWPFSAVASCGNLSCSHHKLEMEDLERFENASGTKQVGCEKCIWWRLEKLHSAMNVCFTQDWSGAAGCSPVLSNMTSSTFTFRLNWSTLKQCLPFLLVCFWKKELFFFSTAQRLADYSLYAECVYVSDLDMCFKEQNYVVQHYSIYPTSFPFTNKEGQPPAAPWETWLLT